MVTEMNFPMAITAFPVMAMSQGLSMGHDNRNIMALVMTIVMTVLEFMAIVMAVIITTTTMYYGHLNTHCCNKPGNNIVPVFSCFPFTPRFLFV